jgi:hypothetical protein
MMSIVAVFLFGVLIGNWMMFLAMWWTKSLPEKIGASGLEDDRTGSESDSQIIYVHREDDSDDG